MAQKKQPQEYGDKAFWVKCSNASCGHCWPAAYWPMEASLFAKVAKASKYCPRCGAGKPFVANQEDGKLLEDVKP